jgi:hypothetical protein
LKLDVSLYPRLQILSVSIFEKIRLRAPFSNTHDAIVGLIKPLVWTAISGRLMRQQSWQEIVDESSIRKRNGESFRPRVMQ